MARATAIRKIIDEGSVAGHGVQCSPGSTGRAYLYLEILTTGGFPVQIDLRDSVNTAQVNHYPLRIGEGTGLAGATATTVAGATGYLPGTALAIEGISGGINSRIVLQA